LQIVICDVGIHDKLRFVSLVLTQLGFLLPREANRKIGSRVIEEFSLPPSRALKFAIRRPDERDMHVDRDASPG
jgi:hypothetical protein